MFKINSKTMSSKKMFKSSKTAVRSGYVKVFINDKPCDLRYIVRSNVYIWCPLCGVYIGKDFFPLHFKRKHDAEAWFY